MRPAALPPTKSSNHPGRQPTFPVQPPTPPSPCPSKKTAEARNLDFEQVGPSPWDAEKDARASALYTKLLFEESDAKAERSSSGGVNGSFLIEKAHPC